MQQPIVILGGTFDPVHNGHLRSAVEVAEFLNIKQVRLVPANNPVHRPEPYCSPAQRLQMLKLATATESLLMVDEREYKRGGPSYMVETLESLREEFGDSVPLILIMGMDAFYDLPDWYQWRRIPELAHILLLERPRAAEPANINNELRNFLGAHEVNSREPLYSRACGCVLRIGLSQLDISASHIRNAVAQGRSVHYLVPEPVFEFIRNNGVYGQPIKGSC